MNELIRGRRLVVCVGPGGVGKTTLASSLALEAASAGRRVALLTIDPAKRLADALGLDGLDDRLRTVTVGLDAAMLDTRASYDSLIERITEDPAARQRILEYRVYRAFSRTLARSHAYVAMERLYDVLDRGEHDLVVLDTPPTRSALEIFDAPGRLVRFLDERVLGAFLSSGGGAAAWLYGKANAVAMRLVGALIGDRLVAELTDFFEVFLHLRRGFSERARAISEVLRSPECAFVLVTAPESTTLADARYLEEGLRERGVPLARLLVNRAFHPDLDGKPVGRGDDYDLRTVEAFDVDTDLARSLLETARALRRELAQENERFEDALRRSFTDAATVRFPILADDPVDLAALRALWAAGVRDLSAPNER